MYGLYGRLWLWVAVAYGTQRLFSSYSLLVLAVTGPFMAKTADKTAKFSTKHNPKDAPGY